MADSLPLELRNSNGDDFYLRTSDEFPPRLYHLTFGRSKEQQVELLKGFADNQTLYLSALATGNVKNVKCCKTWASLAESWIVLIIECDDPKAVQEMNRLNDLITSNWWRTALKKCVIDNAPPRAIYQIVFSFANAKCIIPDVQYPRSFPPTMDAYHEKWEQLSWVVPKGDSIGCKQHENNKIKSRYRPERGLARRTWSKYHLRE